MRTLLLACFAAVACRAEQRVNCEPYRLVDNQPLYPPKLTNPPGGTVQTGWQILEAKCGERDQCTMDRDGCSGFCLGPLPNNKPRCYFNSNYYWQLKSKTEFHQMIYANVTAYSDDAGQQMVIKDQFPGYRESTADHDDPYPPLIKEVRLYVDMESSYRLRVKLEDWHNARFQVPAPWGQMGQALMWDQGHDNRQYEVELPAAGGNFYFNVKRKGGSSIFNTNFPGFVFEDQFLQITAAIPTDYVYGFGEHMHLTWKHDFSSYSRFAMFSRPVHPDPSRDENLYGHHPFFMGLDVATSKPRKAYGVFLLNSNAQEVDKIPMDGSGTTPALTFRTIGGIFDFYFFLGPSPEEVIQQYHEAIGRPYLVPYWSLGFQMSQYWWGTLDEVKNMYNRMVDAGIPWDVVHHDIDYMENEQDFTVDPVTYAGLGDWDREIQAKGMSVVIMLDPFLSFGHVAEYAKKQEYLGWFEEEDKHNKPYPSTDTGFQLDVWTMIENPETGDDDPKRVILEAKVWPGWPMCTHEVKEYYTSYIIKALEDRSGSGCFVGEHGEYCHDDAQKELMKAAISNFNNDDTDRKGHGHRLCHDHLDGLRDFQIHYCRAIVGFPDWWKDTAKQWWKTHLKEFHDEVPYDAIWIDMNEPSNSVDGSFNWRAESYDEDILWVGGGCPENRWNFPPWYPRETDYVNRELFANTLCMSASHLVHGKEELHYNVHSLYAAEFSHPTWEAVREVTQTRSFVFTRSSFAGVGKYIGHWLGDNNSTWPHMKLSTIGLLEFNMFGIPYNGHDICGFFGDTPNDLCMRWLQLGAFYGFWRSHSMKHSGFQDPPSLGPDVTKGTIRVHNTRYSLLPYWYTLFYDASVLGGTVVRSMLAEFYDTESNDLILTTSEQFMVGSALLVAPALEEGVNDVDVYLPEDNVWYDFYSGKKFDGGATVKIHIPLYEELPPSGTNPSDNHVMRDIGLFARGGYVIPQQAPANNTRFSRLNPMGATVAFAEDGNSTGYLYWDDGVGQDTALLGQYHVSVYTGIQRVGGDMDVRVDHIKYHDSVLNLTHGAFNVYGVEKKEALYFRYDTGIWNFLPHKYNETTEALTFTLEDAPENFPPLFTQNLHVRYSDFRWASAAWASGPALWIACLALGVHIF